MFQEWKCAVLAATYIVVAKKKWKINVRAVEINENLDMYDELSACGVRSIINFFIAYREASESSAGFCDV